MIADEIINEIRSRADIVAVIGQHVQLQKAGRNWKGLCPFHGEKTPSFNVIPDKGFFHCFGCQKNGDVFTFVMELEGKSFVEAAEQLGARFGIEVPRDRGVAGAAPRARRARSRCSTSTSSRPQFFREVLADPKRGEAGPRVPREARRRRRDHRQVPARLRAGRLARARRLPQGQARRHGARGQARARRAASRAPAATTTAIAIAWSARSIVPGGDVVGFSARVIGKPPPAPDGSEPPKYINSPESTVYKKSKLLFGLAQAREGMQQNGRAVLVEGNFDVITLHQAGFTEVVAPLGTALTARAGPARSSGWPSGSSCSTTATRPATRRRCTRSQTVRRGRRRGAGRVAAGPRAVAAARAARRRRRSRQPGRRRRRRAAARGDRPRAGRHRVLLLRGVGQGARERRRRARALEDAARLAAKIANPIKRDLIVDTFAKALG